MKQTIAVVISAYNEEKTIGRCLASVPFADEIIVVDNASTDKTRDIAKKFTKNIFDKPNQLMLNANKNFGFEKAKSDWILNLDADEEIPPVLAREIQSIIQSNPSENGFWIKRKNYSFGKWIQHGLWWPDKQIRLFRRTKGAFPCVHIHEYIKVEGIVAELTEPYLHYNYESVHQYLTKIDRASTSEAISLQEAKYQLAWYDAIRFPLSDFLKIYFAQAGFKDGLHGLVLSLFQAFYSFSVFAKVWEMQKFPERDISAKAIREELHSRAKEAHYWTTTMMINESKNALGKIKGKIQRKFVQYYP
jgi:glycosyltransferase involved in cell wall biosynthesis